MALVNQPLCNYKISLYAAIDLLRNLAKLYPY